MWRECKEKSLRHVPDPQHQHLTLSAVRIFAIARQDNVARVSLRHVPNAQYQPPRKLTRNHQVFGVFLHPQTLTLIVLKPNT